jgi:hypothetical protein
MRRWPMSRRSFGCGVLCCVLLLLGILEFPASVEAEKDLSLPGAGRTHCSQPIKDIGTNGFKGTWNSDGTCSGYPEAACGFSA